MQVEKLTVESLITFIEKLKEDIIYLVGDDAPPIEEINEILEQYSSEQEG